MKIMISEDCGENYENTSNPNRFGVSEIVSPTESRDITDHNMTQAAAKAELLKMLRTTDPTKI